MTDFHQIALGAVTKTNGRDGYVQLVAAILWLATDDGYDPRNIGRDAQEALEHSLKRPLDPIR